MRTIIEGYRGVSYLFRLNADRFLPPLVIVAALTLAGWVVRLMGPF